MLHPRFLLNEHEAVGATAVARTAHAEIERIIGTGLHPDAVLAGVLHAVVCAACTHHPPPVVAAWIGTIIAEIQENDAISVGHA